MLKAAARRPVLYPTGGGGRLSDESLNSDFADGMCITILYDVCVSVYVCLCECVCECECECECVCVCLRERERVFTFRNHHRDHF